MDDSDESEISEMINSWLDANMEVFGEILEEWEENNYVQPFLDSKVNFQCNDCGKCCNFHDHWVWVYPYDMVRWLQKIDEEEKIPLFLSALFPVEDLDGISGYGLPSQREISERYDEMIRQNKKNPLVQKTLRAILSYLRKINPQFNPKSEFCIYYSPNLSGKSGHCLIYPYRPIQCRSYPYDYPQFTKFVIPGLEEKENTQDSPMCPEETYIGGSSINGVQISEEQLENVIIEKANYKTSAVIYDWSQESEEWNQIKETDLCDLLLQYFHKDILVLSREKRFFQDDSQEKNQKKKDANKTYIAGKRPIRKKR